jgi:transaldolase
MSKNPLQRLTDMGQSIWLDFLQRSLVTSGKLVQLINEDALRGMTSNPAIFEKSIDGTDDYDNDIRAMALAGKSVPEIYNALTVHDVRIAADAFRPVYDRLDGADGFVSLEVNPHLAYDTDETIKEARRLWKEVDRPNILIKIPATREGLPAITRCLEESINVNVTLLFGLPRYREVVEAYIRGLEKRVERGGDVERSASVASFFLSRIDSLVDPLLEEKMKGGGAKADLARRIRGQVAIASARLAFQIYKEIFNSTRFAVLKEKGARPQRVLWASTSTKNPEYSDVKYVEALIGLNTINTVPMETLDAYRDHGEPEIRLERDLGFAEEVVRRLPDLDIDINGVTQQLEDEGVVKFNKPFDLLAASLERKRSAAKA